jgi:hypothetical protein
MGSTRAGVQDTDNRPNGGVSPIGESGSDRR